MTETVSVIIPLYNARPYITQTIESVVAQTYRDWHLYVMDDWSTDGSADVAKQLAAAHPNQITYQRLDAKGGKPAIGKNAGIRASRGQYIAFMDHDDWYAPGHLTELVAALDIQPETGLIGSNGYFYDGRRKKILGTYRPVGEQLTPDELRALTLRQPPFLTSTCLMLRRSVIDELGPLDEKLGMSDDHELALRVATSLDWRLAALGTPTIYRRWLAGSFSNSPRAMELIIADVETLYRRYSNSPDLTATEKAVLTAWRWQFQKRWANYLLGQGKITEARAIYQQVLAHAPADQQLQQFYRLVATAPWLARLVVRVKRRWSFSHPDIALSEPA